MKRKNSVIVSVKSSRVHPEEFKARELIKWLEAIPEHQLGDATDFAPILGTTAAAVTKLADLAYYTLDLKVGNTLDLLRIYLQPAWGRYPEAFVVHYLEHFIPHSDETDLSGNCFNSCNSQEFENVTDAFNCLKARFESNNPYKVI